MPGPVLITGGAKRLGAAIAHALAAAGHPIVIHAHTSAADAAALAAELNAATVFGDLADPATPARLIAEAVQKSGPLFGLVNNASRFVFDNPLTATAATIAEHIAPNLAAPILLAQAFAAARTLPAGVIVNILDQKLTNLNPDFFSYTLSKAALAAAGEMLAMALAPEIRVCGVAPGIALPGPNQSEQKFAAAWRANPLKRGAMPEDIARAVLFILQTPSITGATITVDGGEHLLHRARDVAFLSGE